MKNRMFCSAFKLIMSTASLYEIKFLLLIFFVPRKRFPSLSFSCFSIKEDLVTANSFVLSSFQVEYDDRKKKKVCHACEGES